jgi:hypothetical protein
MRITPEAGIEEIVPNIQTMLKETLLPENDQVSEPIVVHLQSDRIRIMQDVILSPECLDASLSSPTSLSLVRVVEYLQCLPSSSSPQDIPHLHTSASSSHSDVSSLP